jgi:hypothetical protein
VVNSTHGSNALRKNHRCGPGKPGQGQKEEPKKNNRRVNRMTGPLIVALVAAGAATPALAASGIAPDSASIVTLFAGFSMIGLTLGGRRKRTGRVAD